MKSVYISIFRNMQCAEGDKLAMKDRVLIVDDDPFIVKLLEKVMRSNDLETVSAGSG